MLKLQNKEKVQEGVSFAEMQLSDVGLTLSSVPWYHGLLVMKVTDTLIVTLGNSGLTWSATKGGVLRVQILPKGTTLVIK